METENDLLLNRLYEFLGAELKFHPLVEVVPGLRGGLHDDLADGAAAYSPQGQEVIALDPSYVKWPAEHLRYVLLHEVAHHRLGHVSPAARASAARGAQYVRNEAAAKYTHTIETQADQLTAFYVKSFEAWNERRALQQMQDDIKFIKWAIAQGALTR